MARFISRPPTCSPQLSCRASNGTEQRKYRRSRQPEQCAIGLEKNIQDDENIKLLQNTVYDALKRQSCQCGATVKNQDCAFRKALDMAKARASELGQPWRPLHQLCDVSLITFKNACKHVDTARDLNTAEQTIVQYLLRRRGYYKIELVLRYQKSVDLTVRYQGELVGWKIVRERASGMSLEGQKALIVHLRANHLLNYKCLELIVLYGPRDLLAEALQQEMIYEVTRRQLSSLLQLAKEKNPMRDEMKGKIRLLEEAGARAVSRQKSQSVLCSPGRVLGKSTLTRHANEHDWTRSASADVIYPSRSSQLPAFEVDSPIRCGGRPDVATAKLDRRMDASFPLDVDDTRIVVSSQPATRECGVEEEVSRQDRDDGSTRAPSWSPMTSTASVSSMRSVTIPRTLTRDQATGHMSTEKECLSRGTSLQTGIPHTSANNSASNQEHHCASSIASTADDHNDSTMASTTTTAACSFSHHINLTPLNFRNDAASRKRKRCGKTECSAVASSVVERRQVQRVASYNHRSHDTRSIEQTMLPLPVLADEEATGLQCPDARGSPLTVTPPVARPFQKLSFSTIRIWADCSPIECRHHNSLASVAAESVSAVARPEHSSTAPGDETSFEACVQRVTRNQPQLTPSLTKILKQVQQCDVRFGQMLRDSSIPEERRQELVSTCRYLLCQVISSEGQAIAHS